MKPNTPVMYALFTTDPIHNITTFARAAPTDQELIQWATTRVANTAWFAIYKLHTLDDEPFGENKVRASKWSLHTKFAGSAATHLWRDYTPLAAAYNIDHEYAVWFFKSL